MDACTRWVTKEFRPENAGFGYDNPAGFVSSQMVRNYKKQNKRALWSEETMQLAVDAVRLGEPLKTVARRFHVPRNTLRRHAAGDAPVKKQLGRKTVLSTEQESKLKQAILDFENALYGLTRADTQDLVFQFCVVNNVPNPFANKERAGREWLNGFLQRHPDICIRKPENVSVARAYGFSRHSVNDFFSKYFSLIYDKDGNRIIPNCNIYNVDETGFTIVHRPDKVLAKKGKHAVGILTSAEKGKTITFLPAVSAVGHYIPPLFVFPRKRMKPELLEYAPEGSIGRANLTGWINTEIFEDWFDHFIDTVQPKARPNPTLLLFDGHKSHTKNLNLINKAKNNNVKLLSFPPHCTHKMQPLDRSFFKSLKSNYNHEIHRWLRGHRGMSLSQSKIPEIVNLAYKKTATMENAVNGFRVSGLVPPNEEIFTDEDFQASDEFIQQQTILGDLLPTVPGPADTNTVPGPADTNTVPGPADTNTVPGPADTNTVPADTNTVPAVTNTVPADTNTVPADTNTVPADTNTVPGPANTNTVPGPADTNTVPGPANTNTVPGPANTNTVPGPANTNTVPADTNTVPGPANTNTVPGPANTNTVPGPADTNTVPSHKNTDPVSGPSSTDTDTNVTSDVLVQEISFEDLLRSLSPTVAPKKKRKRKTEKAEIITSSPYKKRLIAEQEAQKEKEAKKQANCKCKEGKAKAKSSNSSKKKTKKEVGGSSKACKPMKGPQNCVMNFYCLYCNELFTDPPDQTWIQCGECKQWAHEAETDYEGTGGFVCDECR